MSHRFKNASMVLGASSTLSIALLVSAPALGATPPSTAPCAAAPPGAAFPRDGCANAAQAPARSGMRMSNRPSDGRSGGTPETSARVPGGPPDDANAGLTFAIPSVNLFAR